MNVYYNGKTGQIKIVIICYLSEITRTKNIICFLQILCFGQLHPHATSFREKNFISKVRFLLWTERATIFPLHLSMRIGANLFFFLLQTI